MIVTLNLFLVLSLNLIEPLNSNKYRSAKKEKETDFRPVTGGIEEFMHIWRMEWRGAAEGG